MKLGCAIAAALMVSGGARAEINADASSANSTDIGSHVAETNAKAELDLQPDQVEMMQQGDTSLFPSWMTSSGGWFEQQQKSISEQVTGTAVGFDSYLARENIDQSLDNSSYLKIQLRQRFSKQGEREFDFKIKASVQLPNSKRDFKLFLDGNPDDFSSIADQKLGSSPGSSSQGGFEETAIAGIGLDKILGANWTSSHKLGVKIRLPLDPYARAEWTHNQNFGEQWRRQVQHRLTYFQSEGWKAQSGLGLYRPINSEFMFQSDSGIQYINQDSTWELFQSFSLHQRISDNTAFEHQIGVSGISAPALDALRSSTYWVRTELRHRLYKDWLFGKIVPELYSYREEGFGLSPTLLLELEVYFGGTPSYSTSRTQQEAQKQRDTQEQVEAQRNADLDPE